MQLESWHNILEDIWKEGYVKDMFIYQICLGYTAE